MRCLLVLFFDWKFSEIANVIPIFAKKLTLKA